MKLDKKSKIYIAGHKGLVGSAIWKNLLKRGYGNLVGREHSELELKDPLAVKSFFDEERPDAVVLCASRVGGIMDNVKHRAEFLYDNLLLQGNVFHESLLHGVKKLLYLSSTCIYPPLCPQPMREDYLLSGPLDYTHESYAVAKIAGLKMCESFNLQFGTNYLGVVPNNLYGPNDNFNLENSHVLPAMIRKMHLANALFNNEWDTLRDDLRNRPVSMNNGGVKTTITDKSDNEEIKTVLAHYGILSNSLTLWGTGAPMREFLWSEDMADACSYILINVDFTDTYDFDCKEIRNCHINIGTGEDIALRDCAELIKNEIGYCGQIKWDSSKPNGVLRKLADVSKLHRLGWHHKVNINEGIHLLYEWYKQSNTL